MSISVLIPAYNAGHLIDGALACLHRQTCPDWNLIVLEDGSNDQTRTKVEAFAASTSQPVRYYNPGVNRGIAASRTELLRLASGEFVAFLDADDYWDDSYLEAAVTTLAQGYDVAVGTVRAFDLDSGRTLFERAPDSGLVSDPIGTQLLQGAVVTSSSLVFRRQFIGIVGEFDAALPIGEDRDYWLRLALAGARFGLMPQVTAHYAKHGHNTMRSTLRWAECDVRFHRKHLGLPQVAQRIKARALSDALGSYGRLLRRSAPRASAVALWEAWQLKPERITYLLQIVYSLALLARGRQDPA